MAAPKFDELFNVLIDAFKALGGSGRNDEVEDMVASLLGLQDKDLAIMHEGSRSKFSYNLAWSRNYLKNYGLLENSSRGVWSLTRMGKEINGKLDPVEVKRKVRSISRGETLQELDSDAQELWKDELLSVVKNIDPAEFERLCQRLLRESGFTDVTVEGKTGDGGIDGRATFKLAGLISIKVIFQCKRYKGSVSSQEIREFKGTMVGRAEKGLFMTTGVFTRSAKEEASRDGSIPIDLVDGDALIEIMKELGLGVELEKTEEVKVDKAWFSSF